MTDLQVPVTAPGSGEAARGILATAAAAKALAEQEAAFAIGQKKFNDALAQEANVLNTRVTPALARARAELMMYKAANAGMGGEGGGIGHNIHMASRIAGRGGGEAGHILHLVGRIAMLNPVMAGLAGAAVTAGLGIHHMYEKEQERLKLIEEESKSRQELNASIKEAIKTNDEAALKGAKGSRGARGLIVASAHNGVDAQARLAALAETGDPAAMAAMGKLLGGKKGAKLEKQYGFDNLLDMAKQASQATGQTVSSVLGDMSKIHGPMTLEKLVGQSLGGKKVDSLDVDLMQQRQRDFNKQTGFDKVNAKEDATGAASLAAQLDARHLLPVAIQEFRNQIDPAGQAVQKFRENLEKTLEPMKARAEAESSSWRWIKEAMVAFGASSENQKFEKERQRILGLER